MRELPNAIMTVRKLSRLVSLDRGKRNKSFMFLLGVRKLKSELVTNSTRNYIFMNVPSKQFKMKAFNEHSTSGLSVCDEYLTAINDLNNLQSNTQTIALAKYKIPKEILPLFDKQLRIAGIDSDKLNRLKIIHVSGTKGKGSTCAFVESILRHAGLKTGFYNSPHLIKVTERIKLEGEPIDTHKFSKYFRYVYDKLVDGTKGENITMPSYFSFLTILAFHIFIEEKVECAIVEVGIGGEYDPTNIIEQPVVCGITSIHFDHTNILGNSIESIAWSKAGIAKPSIPVFTIDQEQNAATEVISERSKEKNCPLFICKSLSDDAPVELGIKGPAQLKNAALACQLARHFLKTLGLKNSSQLPNFPEDQKIDTKLAELPNFFTDGLMNCSWPGRCQIVKLPQITFFLDGAHTKESMENCLSWFMSVAHLNTKQVFNVLMLNVIGERSKKDILRPLAQSDVFNMVIFSSNKVSLVDDTNSDKMTKYQADKSMENVHNNAKTWKCLVAEQNRESSSTLVFTNTSSSVKYLASLAKQNPQTKYNVLVTGSLHFVGAILEALPLFNKYLG